MNEMNDNGNDRDPELDFQLWAQEFKEPFGTEQMIGVSLEGALGIHACIYGMPSDLDPGNGGSVGDSRVDDQPKGPSFWEAANS